MQESGTSEKQNNGSKIVFASMGALYLLVCLCLGMFVYVSRQQIPGIRDYFPTQTAMPTATSPPTATPVVHKPDGTDRVFKDDFSYNRSNWRSKWSDDKVNFKDGNLIVESSSINSIGMTQCSECVFAHSFYMDADFSTNQEIDEGYGISFNIKNGKSAYDERYVFQIQPVNGSYVLSKVTIVSSENVWMRRISKKSNLIKPYPAINKLGAFLSKDKIELYINGKLVDTYQDPGTEFVPGTFGFYVDSGGFQLIVDNLFSYEK